jgi:hypothetical protein
MRGNLTNSCISYQSFLPVSLYHSLDHSIGIVECRRDNYYSYVEGRFSLTSQVQQLDSKTFVRILPVPSV